MRRVTQVILALFLLSVNLHAQVSETVSVGELNPYFNAYMQPFATAMATGMSSGWAHTAGVHKTLGFDISISAAIVNIPDADLTFNPEKIGMDSRYTFESSTAPTMSAKNNVSAPMVYRNFNNTAIPQVGVKAITGVGVNKGAGASIQACIGVPFGTEVMLRIIPDFSSTVNSIVNSNDFKLSKTGMWGFGVKHDIKQWIPVIKKLPFLEISGMLAYSKFKTGFTSSMLNINPDMFSAETTIEDPKVWDNQRFDINVSSFTGSLLIGASLPVFQPFIGVGFNRGVFNAGFKGNYPVITCTTDGHTVESYQTDPISIKSNKTQFNFQAGARLKLGPVVFHGQFTRQAYSMYSGGIAFTFR